MPYIDEKARKSLDEGFTPINSGDLNYLVTKMITRYIASHQLNYALINDIVGALEGAKLEFYRRIVVPYEDRKIKINGDVYNTNQKENKS